jgi:hypothetical protein
MAAKQNSLRVGILGYTGASGKALAHEILSRNIFQSVVLIGRRIVDYKEEFYKNAVSTLISTDNFK